MIDDESSVLTITQQTLEAFGYRTSSSLTTEPKALRFMRSDAPPSHVVLTDMVMPIMDGPATVNALDAYNRQFRSSPPADSTPTAASPKPLATEKHFLPKPYTAETLLTTLHNVLHP